MPLHHAVILPHHAVILSLSKDAAEPVEQHPSTSLRMTVVEAKRISPPRPISTALDEAIHIAARTGQAVKIG
jgi:hypothetical protein